MHTEDYRNFPKPVIIFSQRYMDTTKDNSSELPVGKHQRYETLGHSLQGKLVLANDVDVIIYEFNNSCYSNSKVQQRSFSITHHF